MVERWMPEIGWVLVLEHVEVNDCLINGQSLNSNLVGRSSSKAYV